MIGVRNTILIVDALSEFSHSLREAVFLFAVNAAGRLYPVPNVRYWSNSGQRWILARDGLSANDPTATLAVHCGNGFGAGFSLYQSTRLSR